jgi:hypothetical protein
LYPKLRVSFDQTGDVGQIFLAFTAAAGRIFCRPDFQNARACMADTLSPRFDATARGVTSIPALFHTRERR